MGIFDWSGANHEAEPLTAETLRAGWESLMKRDERLEREYRERLMQVHTHPHKSRIGQLLDSLYIQGGPLIMSPAAAKKVKEAIEKAEQEADGEACS